MKRITWQSTLRTCVAALGVTVLTGFSHDILSNHTAAVAAEDLVKDAATVEEIAKVIDLQTLPLPEGAVVTGERQLGTLNYETDGDLKSTIEFQKKQFVKLGWKEMPGGKTEPMYCHTSFQKSNFVVQVMSYDGGMPDKKSSRVFIYNYGNVRLSKLPVVKGAKSMYSTDAAAGYTTDLKPADAADATRKLLLDSGWEPYGSQLNPPDSTVMTFKRNAIRLNVFAGVISGQAGKVTISYNTSVMAADIPAPTNAKEVGFDDAQKTLQFQSSDTFDDVAKFYQQRLAKMGWTPTSKELSKTKYGDDRPLGELGFKNTAKDSLALRLTEEDGTTKVRLTLRTAADIAALQKELKAAEEKFAAEDKARKEAEEAEAKATAKKPTAKKPTAKAAAAKSDDGFPDVDALIKGAVGDALKEAGLDGKKPAKGAAKGNAADKDAVSVPIPEGAKKVTQTSGNVLQIKFAAGKGKASAEALRDQLLAAGWEAEDGDKIEKNSGNVTFTKDGKTLTLSFVDTGFTDVNMMLIGIGVKLTEGKADPDAKAPAATTKSKPETEPSDDDPLKALKKKLGRKPAKSDDGDDAPAAAPARPEKPKRGIAKLDKLPNEAKLVADGEAISLPNVIAYEIVADGQWVTRILATDTPIKESSLIELLKKNSSDDELRSKSPRVFVELDDQDQPVTMSYAGNSSLGSASGSGLIGEAIVEEGRARGTFKAKKESEFFGKRIIGEITFDVPVLTRDSQPAKQLANAKKLETSGNLVINNKPMKLGNVVAYQTKSSNDEIQTAILFSEKPINMPKLKAALAKDGNDDGYFEFSSQVKVTIDKNDKPAWLNLNADGASINQNTGLVGDVIVEDGRARGTVKLDKPIDFAGKNINFNLTFDIEVLKLPATVKE